MTTTPTGKSPEESSQRVRDIMTTPVVSATADTSVGRIAELMHEKAISGVPVVNDSNRVIGIVTDFDLVMRITPIDPPHFLPLLEGRIPLETKGHFERRIRHQVGAAARDVMTEEVITIGADENIESLAQVMVGNRIDLVPVVENGRLVGVVSRADVIRWMTRDHSPGTDA